MKLILVFIMGWMVGLLGDSLPDNGTRVCAVVVLVLAMALFFLVDRAERRRISSKSTSACSLL